MEMYNANGKGKPLNIRLSKEETEDLVIKKYSNNIRQSKKSKRTKKTN